MCIFNTANVGSLNVRRPIRAHPLTSVYFPHDYLTCEAVRTDALVATRQVLALSFVVARPCFTLVDISGAVVSRPPCMKCTMY